MDCRLVCFGMKYLGSKFKFSFVSLVMYENQIFQDFYVAEYWNRLPQSFKSLEMGSTYENVAEALLVSEISSDFNRKLVLPLSLLAVKKLEETFCISRRHYKSDDFRQITLEMSSYKQKSSKEKLQTELQKRVKPKKLHEIQKMVKICTNTSQTSNVRTIIDFGSGLGHLSRHLQYNLGLDMTCIEQNGCLINEAKRIDKNLETKFLKYTQNCDIDTPGRIFHIEKRLQNEYDFHDILTSIKNNFNPMKGLTSPKLGLIGLHPCGDLAVLLLKSFLKSDEVKFLKIVGCCYMKLTTETTHLMEGRVPMVLNAHEFSFPLSSYVSSLGRHLYDLSYEALESAAHAKEKYLNDLLQKQHEFYKINSYRAAIEAIIVKYWPEKRHSGLKNVRYDGTLSFSQYCKKAVSGLEIHIPDEDITSQETKQKLKKWKRVAIFYLIRLALSPFVESVLLYDRQLFLMENGCQCDVEQVFDPLISPRCHVMSAIKKDL